LRGDSYSALANGVTSGSGIELDPYIIEDWVIGSSSDNGILIANMTERFIVRNCLLENSWDCGIFLSSVNNWL